MASASESPPRSVSTDECWAIVVAGGSGSRFGGDVPKQYLMLNGQRVLDRSLQAMRDVCGDRVVLVVPADRITDTEPLATMVVVGGATRSASVRSGLRALPPAATTVLVHDAARPLVPAHVVDALRAALASGAEAAIPGLPVTDTIKRVKGDLVVETVPREELRAVQTPQAFRVDALARVHANEPDATDDAALIEAAGGRVVVVPGSPLLRKITSVDDLHILKDLC